MTKLHHNSPAARRLIHETLASLKDKAVNALAGVFQGADVDNRIFAANILGNIGTRDAGDVLELLTELKVDLVVAGHKHVPYTWDLNGMPIVTSGTATTRRTRDDTPPSYNIISITAEQIAVTVCDSGDPDRRVERFRRSR